MFVCLTDYPLMNLYRNVDRFRDLQILLIQYSAQLEDMLNRFVIVFFHELTAPNFCSVRHRLSQLTLRENVFAVVLYYVCMYSVMQNINCRVLHSTAYVYSS